MIKLKNISKIYKETSALENVDLDIAKGEVFGLLGPNGAGKTTIIMILSTLMDPTSGEVEINGCHLSRNSGVLKREIGILFQESCLDERLTGRENLLLQATLYDVPKVNREQRIEEMMDFVGLTDWAHTQVEKYSGGMKRRLEIARALLHQPKVLLLDEPTLGLDPGAKEKIWSYLGKLNDMTILLATNYIEEAERLCSKMAIIDSGKIIITGSPESLKLGMKNEIGQVKVKNIDKVKSFLIDSQLVSALKIHGNTLSFTIKKGKKRVLMDSLSNFDLDSIEIRKPTLNDVFFEYTGKSIQVPLSSSVRGRGLGRRKRA